MLFSQSFFTKNIRDKIDFTKKMFLTSSLGNLISRGRGTGEASEATASPEFRGFTTEKFLAS